jgi:hypothetical protein
MKVYIGPYKNWIGTYHIAKKLLFWLDNDHDTVWKFGEWLNNTWVKTCCEWVYSKQKRKVKVKIHNYDVWNMDDTLAHIILPMLKMLRENKQGAPYVDNEDAPEALKKYSNLPDNDVDKNHFARWDYVLNEMIFAFESKTYDWEDQFHSGELDLVWTPVNLNGNEDLDEKSYTAEHGPNHTHVFDEEGWKAMNSRIENGFRLFGKYYSGLWT